MTLADVLDDLRTRGVSLALDGADGLRINAPRGSVSADLREHLRSHKSALLNWLREGQADDGAALPQCTPDPQSVYEPFPLSDLQLGFYMADDPFMEFHVRPHYYVEKNPPALDVPRYEAAWNRALQRHRHEIVAVRPDGQLQTVREPQALRIGVNDLRQQPTADALVALQRTRDAMMRSELPIDRWPWVDLRVSLWREDGRERARVHYNHNNFFSDGYGTTRLLQEIDRCYADPALELPPLELSFRDAALALERLAQDPPGQRARRYWEDRLPGLPDALALPLVSGLDKRCRSRLQRREGYLASADWAAFKQQAQGAGLTPSSAVFATYVEVLARWGNSEHFLLSNMMTRRLNLHPQMQAIVGNFASLYPLEVDLRGRGSFQDGAQRLQEQVIRDARHLQWGGMRVMQALNRRTASLGRAPVPYVVGSGLFMEGFERSDFSCLETSQVLLDHQFWELADGRLYFVWDLLEAFFPAGLIDDLWAAYASLLQRLAHDPGAWLTDPGALFGASTQKPPASDARPHAVPGGTLAGLLTSARRANGDRVAVSCGTDHLDYTGLHDGAHRLAAVLAQAGVVRGDRVAVLADRGPAWLTAVHGVLAVGAADVPIDPTLPAQRCAAMLADCGAAVALCSARHVARDWPATLQVIDIKAGLAPPAHPPATHPPGASDLAYLIYTSGSTGQPKGVMIDHRGALNTVVDVNHRYGVGPRDRLFGVSSIGFDLSVYDVFGAAEAGARVVYPLPEQALNPAHWLEVLAGEAVTVWNSAPPLAALLADLAETGAVRLPDLRLILLSGDWIPLGLPARLRRLAPNARLVSLGGATEASIWSILHEIDAVDPAWPSIPYGRAMDHQHWRILDAHGRDVPVWVTGALCIGGVGLALGYWNDPAKTALAFAEHADDGERLYRTGDLGRLHPDGRIEFLGRRDHQVKVQGHRIELGEIEAALCSHPAVAEAVVLAQRSAAGGASAVAVQLAAHIVCRTGQDATAAALSAHLAERLPAYMVPKLVAFVPRLPLSANGKVDRKALAPLAADTNLPTLALRPPRGAIEPRLMALWSQALGRAVSQVGEDFFDSGGQSFEGVRLVGLMQQTFGVRLSLGDLWQHRCIERQALLVGASGARHEGPLRTLAGHGSGVPLFLVHPAGGSVLCYRHLAARLDQPVHAFEARTGDTGLASGTTVEDLAATYLQALTLAHPTGPLLLGGWSSGGPIAFDLAARLRRAGRAVVGLVIIDSPAPADVGTLDDTQVLGWFIEDLDLPPAALRCAVAWATRAELAGSTHASRLAALEQVLAQNGHALPLAAAELVEVYRCFDGVVRATAGYRAPRLDVPMLVLRAARGSVTEFARHPHADEPGWGWHRHTQADLRTHVLDATHQTLLTPDTAAQCSDLISRWSASLASASSSTTTTGEAR